MSAIPTVKIRAGDSYAIINVADFDPKVHKVYLEHEATVAYPTAEVERVWVDPGPYVEMSVDPPCVETNLGSSEESVALEDIPEAIIEPAPTKRRLGRPKKK